jgi:hypothetical protein
MDTERQDRDLQWRGASMRTRCPPTTNEYEAASADELNSINAARKPNRFIGSLPVYPIKS